MFPFKLFEQTPKFIAILIHQLTFLLPLLFTCLLDGSLSLSMIESYIRVKRVPGSGIITGLEQSLVKSFTRNSRSEVLAVT